MVTLKELAKLLNVSVSTVSKALSDSSEIGESTKKRVLELAKELNYKPNRIAQQLKSNQTKVIGIIVPSVMNPFFAEVLHAIETTLAKADYDIIVSISHESFEKEQRSLEVLASGSVDGFIMATARETQLQDEYSHLQDINKLKPMVMFDRVLAEINCSKVVVDDFQSVYEATNYLIQKEQRKNILLISNIEELSVGKYRIDGYTKAIEQAGLDMQILKLGRIDNPRGTIYSYLKNNPKTDAIVSIDHISGIMALNKIKLLGKTVPEDVSLISFGYADTALVSSPNISVIDQKASKIGETAAKLLLKGLKDKDQSIIETVVVNSNLVLNDTTKNKA